MEVPPVKDMKWYKDHYQTCDCDLTTSNIMSVPFQEALGDPGDLEELRNLELGEAHVFGHPEILSMLSLRYGVERDCIYTAEGTSMLNYLYCAALLDRGDRVLIETPNYESLIRVPELLGCRTEFFPRLPEERFRLNADIINERMTQDTRLIILTNLHNPSGMLATDAELRAVGDIAADHGARVLCDEVYREFAVSSRTSFLLDPEVFIVTTSPTRVYGIGGVRIGWGFAPPELNEKAARLKDYLSVVSSSTAEAITVLLLRNIDRLLERSLGIAKRNRKVVKYWLRVNSEFVKANFPEHGIICFPEYHGDGEALAAHLRDKYSTLIATGSHYGLPGHFRLGMGGEGKVLEKGLSRISVAMRDLDPVTESDMISESDMDSDTMHGLGYPSD